MPNKYNEFTRMRWAEIMTLRQQQQCEKVSRDEFVFYAKTLAAEYQFLKTRNLLDSALSGELSSNSYLIKSNLVNESIGNDQVKVKLATKATQTEVLLKTSSTSDKSTKMSVTNVKSAVPVPVPVVTIPSVASVESDVSSRKNKSKKSTKTSDTNTKSAVPTVPAVPVPVVIIPSIPSVESDVPSWKNKSWIELSQYTASLEDRIDEVADEDVAKISSHLLQLVSPASIDEFVSEVLSGDFGESNANLQQNDSGILESENGNGHSSSILNKSNTSVSFKELGEKLDEELDEEFDEELDEELDDELDDEFDEELMSDVSGESKASDKSDEISDKSGSMNEDDFMLSDFSDDFSGDFDADELHGASSGELAAVEETIPETNRPSLLRRATHKIKKRASAFFRKVRNI